MSPKTIKIIDYVLGQPLCFFLTLARYVFGGVRKHNKKSPSSILFIKLIEQGATVLAYSAIRRAVEMVGREHVYFCVFKENRPILDIMAIVPDKNIFEIRQENIFVFIADILRCIAKARKIKIDSTVDMEFFSRASAILAFLTGAGIRVGLHRFNSELPYRGDLMTHRVQHNPYLHIASAYLLLVESLPHDPNEIPLLKIPADGLSVKMPEFDAQIEEKQKIEKLITEKLGAAISHPLVLLNPNAGDMLPLRKWTIGRFIQLGKMIREKFPQSTLVLTGAPSEQGACELIRKEFNDKRVVSMAGFTALKDLLVLYSISDLLITNDSGPGHFASMTTVNTIVMFGPETPQLFRPLGKNIHVLWKNLACSPCVNAFNHRFSPCVNNVCMQEISVEDVFKKAVDLLYIAS